MIIRMAAFALLLLAFCASVSCKSDSGKYRTDETAASFNSIEFVKSEIENAVIPGEVEPGVFENLRAFLLSEIERLHGATAGGARITAAAPQGAAGKVTDLSFDAESGTLSWSYVNTGDYDLSGDTGIPDITPIALNYLKTVEYLPGGKPAGDIETPVGLENHRLAWIDGDKNGEIGISDVTPIALNYLANVAAYRFFTAASPSGPLAQTGADIPIGQTGTFPIRFGIAPPAGAQLYIAVAPVDALGSAGPMSNLVALSADAPPVISGVSPQGGESGAQVTFSADVAGSPPYVFSWNFGGASSPNVSADASPAVILGAPGVYPASVAVSNAAGSDQFNFLLNVTGANSPPEIISVSPLTAEEAEIVYFTAVISGSPPFNYAWDFGGGALPGVSNQASPQVTIDAEGSYACSLIVGNAFGTDSFDFTLDVAEYNEPPVAVASVTPYVADSPGEFTLFSTGSGDPDGTIVKYEWDFESDGIFDYESETPSPVIHIYPGEAAGGPREGKYRARLRVTDDRGKTATVQTPVFISNDAHLYWTWEWVDGGTEVGYDAGGGANMLIDPRDGRPCIVYVVRGLIDSNWGFEYVQIKVAWKNPGGSWEFDTFEYPRPYPIEFADVSRISNALFLPNGTLVMAVQRHRSLPLPRNDRLDYLKRSPSGVWEWEIVDNEGKVNGQNVILDLDSAYNPAIVYTYATDDNSLPVREVRYATRNGLGWEIQPVDRGDLPFLQYTDFKVIDGISTLLWNTVTTLSFVEFQEASWVHRLVAVPSSGEFKNYSKFTDWDGDIRVFAANTLTLEVLCYTDRNSFFEAATIHHPLSDAWGIFNQNPALASTGSTLATAFTMSISGGRRTWVAHSDGLKWREEPILEIESGISNGLAFDFDGNLLFAVYQLDKKELFFGIREPFLKP